MVLDGWWVDGCGMIRGDMFRSAIKRFVPLCLLRLESVFFYLNDGFFA